MTVLQMLHKHWTSEIRVESGVSKRWCDGQNAPEKLGELLTEIKFSIFTSKIVISKNMSKEDLYRQDNMCFGCSRGSAWKRGKPMFPASGFHTFVGKFIMQVRKLYLNEQNE